LQNTKRKRDIKKEAKDVTVVFKAQSTPANNKFADCKMISG